MFSRGEVPRKHGIGSVRFVSVPDFFRKIIGSVRFGSDNSFSRFDAVRPSFFGRVVARSGSVRFRVRFRPVPELNGSVRFGSAASVRFLIPSRWIESRKPTAQRPAKYFRTRATLRAPGGQLAPGRLEVMMMMMMMMMMIITIMIMIVSIMILIIIVITTINTTNNKCYRAPFACSRRGRHLRPVRLLRVYVYMCICVYVYTYT